MSRWFNITVYMLIVVLSFAMLSGCGNTAEDSAIIGAVIGAGVGAITGGDTASVIIGSSIGAGAGYYIGDQFENDKNKSLTRNYKGYFNE